jgi:hypothetical protein
MSMRVWRIVLAAAVLALAAGCSTKSSGDSGPSSQPQLPGQAVVDQANLNRLEKLADNTTYGVKGTLSVKNLTLLNSAGKPVKPGLALSELDARLLDPEDDILAAVKPGADGKFNLAYKSGGAVVSRAGGMDSTDTVRTLLSARLVISGKVQQDLNGDGTANDDLRLAIPVALIRGQAVSITASLSYGDRRYVDPTLVPAVGWFILASLAKVDSDGAAQQLCGVFYHTSTTIFDTNGNNYLEFTDYSGADTNTDGQVDDFQGNPLDPGVQTVALQGQITAVNPALLTITLHGYNGLDYTLQLEQLTPIELWTTAGAPIGVLPLGTQLIGMYATTEGPVVSGIVHPWQIITYQVSASSYR